MRIVDGIVRLYSLLFHFLLSLFLFGISVLSFSAGHPLQIESLPFRESQAAWLLAGGILGLLSVVLAAVGRLRFLFALWATVVMIVIARGYFLSSYVFDGQTGFRYAVLFFVGSVIAFIGSLRMLRRADDRRR